MKPAIKLILLSLISLVPAAQADIYGFTDDAGALVLSNVPQDGRYALLLKVEIASDKQVAQPMAGGKIEWAQQKALAPLVAETARAYQLDEALLHAVIATESGYNPRARSPKGALGLMQVMPATGRRYGAVNLTDPAENLRAGARYLKDLLALFNHDLPLVLAAYNAGENAVVRHGHRIPPYQETQRYVPRVLALYKRFSRPT